MDDIYSIICRNDKDIPVAADLIVATDEYIYPPMFRLCPEERYAFFEKCINDRSSLFFKRNILFIKDGDKIVGALVAFFGERVLTTDGNYSAFKSEPDIKFCEEHYFAPILKEYKNKPDSIYILTFCIRSEERGKGYGSRLLSDFIAMTDGDLELDVLCDNEAAIRLYQKHGFEIKYSEDAFALENVPGLRSYRMVLHREKYRPS